MLAASAALSGGATAIALSGAGVDAENGIEVHVRSYVDGDTAATLVPVDGVVPSGISAASADIHATDTSTIKAIAGAVSLAFAFGGGSFTLSVGISLAQNTIANVVEASISNAKTSFDTGDGRARAHCGGDRLDRRAYGRGLAGLFGRHRRDLVQRRGGGRDEHDPHAHERVRGHVERLERGALTLLATDKAGIHAVIAAASASFAAGGVGAAGSIGVALARNLIGFSHDPTATWTTSPRRRRRA